jgi:hypothetical protein
VGCSTKPRSSFSASLCPLCSPCKSQQNREPTSEVDCRAGDRVRLDAGGGCAPAIRALLEMPEIARVTYLHLEFVGPRMVSVIGDVDLAGEHTESQVAVQLRALEAKLSASPAVAGAVLSLSAPDEPSLGL